jgi:threonine/homoserine/homoserine lactone efflux protein
LWILVVSALSLQSARLPRPLTYVGLAYGVLLLLIPVALLTSATTTLLIVVVVLSAIAGPIWWIWSGLQLLEQPETSTQTAR